MKSRLFFSLIIVTIFTLTACAENDNEDKTDTASAPVEEIVEITETEPAEMDATISAPTTNVNDSASDAVEVIKENIESIQENVESNP